jgi:hypothetical protein
MGTPSMDGNFKYGRNLVSKLHDDMFDREIWWNTMEQVSFGQKKKHQTDNNTNTSTCTKTAIAEKRGRPSGKKVPQTVDVSPI